MAGDALHHCEFLHPSSFSTMLAFTNAQLIRYCDVHTVLCQVQVKEKWVIKRIASSVEDQRLSGQPVLCV